MTQRAGVFATLLPLLLPTSPAQTLHRETIIVPPGQIKLLFTDISPAGLLVAGACSDGAVRLWNLLSGGLVRTLDMKAETLTELDFLDDGKLLAAGGSNGTVRMWDLASGALRLEFMLPATVGPLALTPDKHLLTVVRMNSAAQLWDVSAGKAVATFAARFSDFSLVVFSRDANLLALADGDTNIRIYDARSGALRTTTTDLLLETFAGVFSAEGKFLFAGGADKTISIIDAASGRIVRSLPKQQAVVAALLVSRDGNRVAAEYIDPDDPRKPAAILLWDVAAQTVRATIPQPEVQRPDERVHLLGFVTDGRLVLTSRSANGLTIWFAR